MAESCCARPPDPCYLVRDTEGIEELPARARYSARCYPCELVMVMDYIHAHVGRPWRGLSDAQLRDVGQAIVNTLCKGA